MCAYGSTIVLNPIWMQLYHENINNTTYPTQLETSLHSYAKTTTLSNKNKKTISKDIRKHMDFYESVSILYDQKFINVDHSSKQRNYLQYMNEDTFGTLHTFQVQWKNRKTWVYVNMYPELYGMQAIEYIEIGIIFSFYVLILYGFMKKRVQIIEKLTQDISYLENGDWTHAIGVEGQDELGRLAQQIDEMRLYAYENQQAERRASQANHDLITSMSHVIRTPLATLKRDLEILSLKKGEEERQAFYIQRCLKKTDELIDLSEALFKQSLHVSDSKELHMGKMAIQEIIALLNQIDDLKKRGYDIQFVDQTMHGCIEGNLPLVHRIFNNLSSNIIKYADKQKPIHILTKVEKGEFYIRFENYIASTKDVESNHIGLQSVQMSMKQLQGSCL